MKKLNQAVTLAIAALVVGFTAVAHAEDTPQKKKDFATKHPRRAEVLARKNNEKAKNSNAEAKGEITKGQEKKLNQEDNKIGRQEQRDSKVNGGHITKAEQTQLNREENHVNKQRNNMEERDKAAPQPGQTAPASAPAPAAPVPGNN